MQSKTTQYVLIAVIAIFLLGGAFSGGVLVGWLVPVQVKDLAGNVQFPVIPSLPAAGATPGVAETAKPQDTTTLFKPFWEAWNLVHQEYVTQPVDDTSMMRGAIK